MKLITKLIAYVLLAAVCSMAGVFEVFIPCLSVNGNDIVHLSDINQPKAVVNTETKAIEFSDFVPSAVADSVEFAAVAKVGIVRFTRTTFANVPTDGMKSIIALCPSTSYDDAISLMRGQHAPYVIFNDVNTNLETWSYISVKDAKQIEQSGGKIKDTVVILKKPISSFEAAVEGYVCGPETFDWITAYKSIDAVLVDYQTKEQWSGSYVSRGARMNAILQNMPMLPSCVKMDSMHSIVEKARKYLDEYPCRVQDGNEIIDIKRCIK